MDETRFQMIRSVAFAASFALVYAFQVLAPYRAPRALATPSWRQNLPLAILNTGLMGLVCGGCVCAIARVAATRGWGLLHALQAPAWVGVAATVMALDLVLWMWHRASHRLPWLWRFHRVHHSDVDFDVTTAVRFHAGELLLSLPVKIGAVVALGASLAGLLLFEIVFGLFNLFIHGSLRMPPAWEARMARVFVIPAVHRRHHSIKDEHRATNFGTVLCLWDRLFGTWGGGGSTQAVVVGLPDLAGPERPTLGRCLVLPFERRRAGAAPV